MSHRRLVLHAGWNKTGTTSIQGALVESTKVLKKSGWQYRTPVDDAGKPARAAHAGVSVTASSQRIEATIRNRVLELLFEGESDVVVSSEMFCWLIDPGEIARLRQIASAHFDEITVVFYLRRQDRLAASHKQTGARLRPGGQLPAGRLYGHDLSALPELTPAVRAFLDFEARLEPWFGTFGDASVEVRIVDDEFLVRGDVVADLSSVLGTDLVDAGRQNESWPRDLTLLGHLVLGAPSRPKGPQWRSFVSRFRAMREELPREPLRPSRSAAVAFQAPFIEGNRRLADRLGFGDRRPLLFDDDFSEWPEEGNDSLTGEDAERLIGLVLEAFGR